MMKAIIVDNSSDSLQQLEALVTSWGFETSVTNPDNIDTNCDLIVLSGGIWYDDPKEQAQAYRFERELLQTMHTPILGICLGAMLMAQAHGATLKIHQRINEAIPVHTTDITEYFPAMLNRSKSIDLLPATLKARANSELGVEVFTDKFHPFIGVLFHPELSESQAADYIHKLVVDKIAFIQYLNASKAQPARMSVSPQ